MCFDICTINIRVSIRVRGLHLVISSLSLFFLVPFFLSLTIPFIQASSPFRPRLPNSSRSTRCPMRRTPFRTYTNEAALVHDHLRDAASQLLWSSDPPILNIPTAWFLGCNLCCLNRSTALSILSFFLVCALSIFRLGPTSSRTKTSTKRSS